MPQAGAVECELADPRSEFELIEMMRGRLAGGTDHLDVHPDPAGASENQPCERSFLSRADPVGRRQSVRPTEIKPPDAQGARTR
jgi:hypothetical protein